MITGTTSDTTYLDEKGNEVFPCRCGEVHEGDYACEEYLHHECLHDTSLDDIGDGLVICMDCGRTWRVDA